MKGRLQKVIFVYAFLSKELICLKQSDEANVFLTESLDEGLSLIEEDCVIILDDLLTSMRNRTTADKITNLFIRGVHHQRYEYYAFVYMMVIQ